MEWIVIGFKIGVGLTLAILDIVVIAMIVVAIISVFDGPMEDVYCGCLIWFGHSVRTYETDKLLTPRYMGERVINTPA